MIGQASCWAGTDRQAEDCRSALSQHECRNPRDVRRGHGGAGHRHVAVADAKAQDVCAGRRHMDLRAPSLSQQPCRSNLEHRVLEAAEANADAHRAQLALDWVLSASSTTYLHIPGVALICNTHCLSNPSPRLTRWAILDVESVLIVTPSWCHSCCRTRGFQPPRERRRRSHWH
jgi:hypothetical protein